MTTSTKTRWILLMTVTLLIVSTGGVFAASGKILKMAYVAPTPVWGPIADYYADEVAKVDPNLQVKSFGSAQLGPLPKNFADLKMGNLDLMFIDAGVLMMPKGGSHFSVIFAPYAFNSQAHFRKFIGSELFKTMIVDTEKTAGMKYIGYVGDRSPRLITTSNREVITPADMKGLKLRVAMVPPIRIVLEAWGASPTPLSASELYMGMKQGVVDGQDNGFDAIFGAKFYEVQKYVSPINYIRSGIIIIASASVWNKLSKNEQKALIDALEPTEKWASKRNDEIVAKSIIGVKEKGMIILEPDVEAFKQSAAVIVKEKLDGKLWPAGLYEKIRAMD